METVEMLNKKNNRATPILPPESRSTKRANRFERRPPANGLFLTERDIKILTAVYRGRYLTAEQIERLFFGCRTRANVRLRRLFDHAFLDRHFPCPMLWRESACLLYSLGKNGIPIVERALGVDREQITRHRSGDRNFSPFQIEHLFAINEFQITLSLEAQRRGITLETWLSERELHSSYSIAGNDQRIIRPDGYGRILHEGKLYSFFLEADLGTEALSVIKKKLSAYIEYRESGEYHRTFGLKRFRVLMVTNSLRRLKNIKPVAERVGMEACWLTTFDALKSSEGAFGGIWMRSGASDLRPFI